MAKRAAAGTLALAVCLTGGAALASSAQAATGFKFDARVGGADRFETAALASAKAFKTADTVVVVNYMATVDGLSASYAAGLHNAPVLYTKANELPDVSAAEIDRLGAKNIIIVGGEGVVSADLKKSWESEGFSVTRYAGDNRYETAAEVAASGDAKPGKVFVANGNAPADALAVGPIAFAKHYPILLTKSDEVPTATSDELAALGTSTRIVAGGNAVVSDSTMADLKASKRLYGANRQGTAVDVSKWAIATEGFSNKDAALVGNTDANTADALVAAPLAGKNGVTLLFTQNGTVGTATGDYLKSLSATLTGKGYVFGGTGAISNSIADEATKIAAGAAVTTNQSYTVTTHVSGSASFQYANPATKQAVTVTALNTDTFTVDGAKATFNAFIDALAPGDIVTIAAPASAGGATTYNLINVTVSSGLIGSFSGHTGTIVDRVTGVQLGASWVTNTSGVVYAYTVDGAAVNLNAFEAAISAGDTIAITGTGVDATHVRTLALTSGSLSGVAAPVANSLGSTSAGINVETESGVILQTGVPVAGDSFSIDGKAVTLTEWNAYTGLSAGDKVSYSKPGGIQNFALVNAAPASVSGVVSTADTTANTSIGWYTAGGVHGTVNYTSGVSTFKVDGVVSSAADFSAAAVPGAWVTYQELDTTTNTAGTLSITSKPLVGSISVATDGKITVRDTNERLLVSGLDTHDFTKPYVAGKSAVYSVDGTVQTQAQFDAMLQRIYTGARTGTIQISISGGVVTYGLSTVVAPAPVIASLAHAKDASTVVLTVSKQSTATSALAATDFVVTKDGVVKGTKASGSTPDIATAGGVTTITLTLDVAPASETTSMIYSVTPTAAGAAKIVDANGTALTVSTVSHAAS